METKSPFEQFDELRIDTAGRVFLKEVAGWTAFLAILGFIGIGFIVIIALFAMIMGSYISMGPFNGGSLISLIYLAVALFYFFPVNYLYRFSSNIKAALKTNDQTGLTKAFEYLKSHYKFIGILTIIIFGMYILVFLGIAFSGFKSMI